MIRDAVGLLGSERYAAGWTTHDRVADPKWVRLTLDGSSPHDLRLQAGSPAIGAGQPLPVEWPDPLRNPRQAQPDIGALVFCNGGGRSWLRLPSGL